MIFVNILDELRHGNVESLKEITFLQRVDTIEAIQKVEDCDTILNTILPILQATNDWYEMESYIFKLIYLRKGFEEYTKYLLKNPISFRREHISNLIEYTSWGLDYIYDHLENLLLTNIMSPLLTYKIKNHFILNF